MLRFSPVPPEHGQCLGQPYEAFAKGLGITDATTSCAEERARETNDVVLRIQYLAFVLGRTSQSGRA